MRKVPPSDEETTSGPPKALVTAALGLESQLARCPCFLCLRPEAEKALMLVPEFPSGDEVAPPGMMRFLGIAVCDECTHHPHHEAIASELVQLRLRREGLHGVTGVVFVDVQLANAIRPS